MLQQDLSIFIPTYKRKQPFFEAVASTSLFPDCPVIVSDNNDDPAYYNDIESFLSTYPNTAYHRNPTNIGIDKNMLRFLATCTTKYCLLLGDDDKILPSFSTVFERVDADVDFVVLNCSNADGEISAATVEQKGDAFLKFWDRLPFGLMIVNVERAKQLEAAAHKYVGTSHAYSAVVWELLFSNYSTQKIAAISTKVIELGEVEKSWKENLIQIHFTGILDWFKLLPQQLSSVSKIALSKFYQGTFTAGFFKNCINNNLLTSANYNTTVNRLPLAYRIRFWLVKLYIAVTRK